MAPSVRLVLLVAILLSLAGSLDSAPERRGVRGWTLNSAGYLLGPVVPVSQMADPAGKKETALEILDLWKAIDELPYSNSHRTAKRSPTGAASKPEKDMAIRSHVDMLGQSVLKEDDTLQS